jgi:hypothetical protein
MSCRSWIAASALLVITLPGCRREPADSTTAEFARLEDRIAWMEDAISGGPPSPIRDAHFWDKERKVPPGHMMPGYTTYHFLARIEIDPEDAPKWAARTNEIEPPRWRKAIVYPAPYGAPEEEFAGCKWYDPDPLFPPGAHPTYRRGVMAINAAGDEVYVWQRWD